MQVKGVHKFLKRSSIDLLLFGFVQGVRHNFAGITVKSAISQFMKVYELSEEDLNIDSAMNNYMRMQHEFYEHIKHDQTEQTGERSKK